MTGAVTFSHPSASHDEDVERTASTPVTPFRLWVAGFAILEALSFMVSSGLFDHAIGLVVGGGAIGSVLVVRPEVTGLRSRPDR